MSTVYFSKPIAWNRRQMVVASPSAYYVFILIHEQYLINTSRVPNNIKYHNNFILGQWWTQNWHVPVSNQTSNDALATTEASSCRHKSCVNRTWSIVHSCHAALLKRSICNDCCLNAYTIPIHKAIPNEHIRDTYVYAVGTASSL